MNKKHTIKSITRYFKDNGCTLLEEEYVNTDTHMRYICKCGNTSIISFTKFKQGRRCKKCSRTEKHTYEYVYNYFKEHGCILLEEKYISTNTKMNYICSCGNPWKTSLSKFKSGQRCKACRYKKMSENQMGEKNHSWKKNREEIKLLNRLRKSFSKKWVVNNLCYDPNYNDFLNNPKKYNVDHIIPIKLFRDILIEYNLNPDEVKYTINKKENLQLLTKEDNMKKKSKGCLFLAAQYLMLNGIKLIK